MSSFIPKKRLGQNFLTDKKSLERIISCAEISPSDIVLEVGPGLGTLTDLLQAKAKRIIAVEKDPELVHFLRKKFQNNFKVEIIEADILKISLPEFNKVVSTPPYNISSRLLFLLLKKQCDLIVLVLQKEFAERMVAKLDTREYSRLTVMVTSKAQVEIIEYITREAFRPKPKVESAIVKIRPKQYDLTINEELFSDLVRGLFTQRKRKLRSSLKHYIEKKLQSVPKEISNLNIPDKRVFQVSVGEFEELAKNLEPILITSE